jgi:photosystem II stability/assembly factor-like uncharacterized protein
MATSKDKTAVRLEAISYAPNHSTVFFSSLPEGEYTLMNIRGLYSAGDLQYSRWVNADETMGTFKIKSGQITDLGKIIHYTKVSGDRYKDLLVPIPRSSALTEIPQGNLLPNMDISQVSTWDDDGREGDRQALYSNIVQNPVTYNDRYLSKNGNLYLVGKLGFIFKRDKLGNWSNDAVDTDFDITAVAETESGILIVGGESGQIFIKDGDGKWQPHPVPADFLIDAINTDADGNIFVIAHTTREAKVFTKSTKNINRGWTAQATLDPITGWKNDQGQTFPIKYVPAKRVKRVKPGRDYPRAISSLSFIEFSGKMYIATFLYIGNTPNLIGATNRYLHEISSDFSTFTPKADFNEGVDGVVKAGVGFIGIKKPNFFTLTPTYFRFDAATNDWVKIGTAVNVCRALGKENKFCKSAALTTPKFNFVGVPVFIDANRAYALAQLWHGGIDGIDGEYIAIDTEDGGKTWTYNKKPLPNGKFCLDTISQVSDSILVFCNGVSADFYQSNDQGVSWQHVRESVKF